MNIVDAEIIKDGTSHLISNNTITGTSLEVLSFVPSNIKKRRTHDTSEGRAGRINYSEEYEYRTVRMTVESTAVDIPDIAHLRDAVNELFDGEFYIREKRIRSIDIAYESLGDKTGELDLGESDYVNGKQLYVAHFGDIEIDDSQLTAVFDVELETVILPYFESCYTTLELHDSGYTYDTNKYGTVDNIHVEKVKYRFTENEFIVYNAGNVAVLPESMLLDIGFRNVTTTGNFTLRNETTGEEHVIKSAHTNRHLRANGMIATSGTTNNFRNTNRKFVSLAPGDNRFKVTGGTFERIDFDFKYYYK